jgi:dihydroorotate dehydrogenase (NAD+) catalytic subunit
MNNSENKTSGGVDLTTRLGPLTLKNPVLVCSGTFGTGEEYADFFDLSRLGGLVTKAVTLEPRAGNPPPRIVETPSGLLNAIGLENVGLERFIEEKMPFLRGLDTTVIVNVAGSDMDEYRAVAERLSACEGVHALELNISCPNVKHGGVAFGTDPAVAAALTARVRAVTRLPLIVKLTPNVTDPAPIAKAVADAGADILSLVNTFRGMAIDVRTQRPVLGNTIGGLSGPAIRPLALHCVYHVSCLVNLPIIGMGGIMNAQHAIEFLLAGATAVSVGTANLANPLAAVQVIEGIADHCRELGIDNPARLVGRAHTAPSI